MAVDGAMEDESKAEMVMNEEERGMWKNGAPPPFLRVFLWNEKKT